jgi:hypothetical protein
MKSKVAGILDSRGGLRVVVTTKRSAFQQHLKTGERLFIVPGFKVQEPVPWDDIPQVIERVRAHVRAAIEATAPDTACGGCTACCYMYWINDPDLQKPSRTHCPHCVTGQGCQIYDHRPGACREFKCRWLRSQSVNDRMGPELRPDRCGAFFTEDSSVELDSLIIECHGEPNGDAWQWIYQMQAVGYKVKKITHYGDGK